MTLAAEKLIIFVKAPRPGLVKTRLAASLGATGAAIAYQTLVRALLERLRDLPAVELRFSPDDALSDIEPWLGAGWLAHPQGPGDLGQRLQSAFVDAFASGARRIVIIGSDCPDVAVEDIRLAWASLSRHDVVLGPALDGGYWLVGLREPQPQLFENIAWSTDTVLAETQRRCLETGLDLCLLRELKDIDTEDDWITYCQVHQERAPRGVAAPGPKVA